MIKQVSIALAAAVVLAGCTEKPSRPFGLAVGDIKVEGTGYYSVFIFEAQQDGTHMVGGFVSDETLGDVAVGPDNPENSPLQIIPDEGVIIHHGQKTDIENNGYLVWIVAGKIVEQNLEGFPLEEELKKPPGIPAQPRERDGE